MAENPAKMRGYRHTDSGMDDFLAFVGFAPRPFILNPAERFEHQRRVVPFDPTMPRETHSREEQDLRRYNESLQEYQEFWVRPRDTTYKNTNVVKKELLPAVDEARKNDAVRKENERRMFTGEDLLPWLI